MSINPEEDFIVEGEGENGAAELKKLRDKLKACVAEKQDYLDGWQRARADFANLKKDEALRRGELSLVIAADFAEHLIPLVDSFEAGMRDGKWEETDPSWRRGMESIYKEFQKALEKLGVESFDPKGEQFDPARHVAVGREGEGEVVHTVERKGYVLKEKILRPAYVTIGK